ncbi:MAG: hypothetical protein HQ528_02960 [Candidatus Marinimicrobia bacterium]|nr:hypothetical protein [Candidatus Neomarinimicrobiota bacterium]
MYNIKNRVWYDLVTTGYQSIYSSIYNKKIRNISDWFNIIIAITSSASVGAWAIWNNYQYLWGAIIGIGQIINIIKPYIPSIKDSRLYHELQLYFEEYHFELDYLWLQITLGELTENEIRSEYKKIFEKYFNQSKKFLLIRIDEKSKISEKAENEWNIQIAKYGVENE